MVLLIVSHCETSKFSNYAKKSYILVECAFKYAGKTVPTLLHLLMLLELFGKFAEK